MNSLLSYIIENELFSCLHVYLSCEQSLKSVLFSGGKRRHLCSVKNCIAMKTLKSTGFVNRIIALSCLCFFTAQLKAQWVTLPDTNFVNWLNANGYSSCLNGNQLDTTCPAVVNASIVDCNNYNIQNMEGIQYFDNLDTLKCFENSIVYLPRMSNSVKMLLCYTNLLDSLPTLPDSLSYLDCSGNNLTYLPPLPGLLRDLKCIWNQLTTIPPLPNQLRTLKCNNNQITGLPSIPVSLITLDCYDNQLTSLPPLPSVYYLRCWNNQLTSLPALPSNMWELSCFNNRLTSLPVLPPSLQTLSCGQNQITALPSLPNTIVNFDCQNNLLTSIPAFPASVQNISVGSNQLTSLPELPDSIWSLNCFDNPLVCLPQLKYIGNHIDFRNTNVSCLPNYGSVASSYPPLSSLPLCNLFNDDGCPVFWNVSGKAYYDSNRDCGFDSADVRLKNVNTQLKIGGVVRQQTLTGGEGFYSFDLGTPGNYELSVDTANIPFRVLCPANNLIINTLTAVDSLQFGNDFSLECKNGFDLVAWSICSSVFRPAAYSAVYSKAGDLANFYGVRCAIGVSGSVQLVMSGPVRYISPMSGSLTPTSVSGNTVTWSIPDFGNVNFFSDFNIIVQTDTHAAPGSIVCFTLIVNPIAGDNNPANNSLTHCFPVVNSYDPNDKQVYPLNDIDSTQKELTYTIRFQNTGTAVAQHIYIDDTLDSDLGPSTFQLLAYSHEPLVQIWENFVRFNFPNINLPDSTTDEPASHGYVQFKVKLKENLTAGTQIQNTAYIYFDFNPPVVTNTTVNTIAGETLVWPGDANADGIANNYDVLAVGVAYGANGPARQNPSANWVGQLCPDWADSLSNGVNYKHADCNGDSFVDENDISAILSNYILVHQKMGDSLQSETEPTMFLQFPHDTFQTGDTVTGTIHLGTQASPVSNVYGVAFSLSYDPNIITSTGITVDFTNSWIRSTQLVSLSKDMYAASRVDIGLSRTSHSDTSGFGVLANVSFVIQDNIDGKDYFVLPLEIQFEDVVAIDKDEANVNITANGDTLYVEGETVGINPIHHNYNVSIFPNPAADEINVMAGFQILECRVLDIAGRELYKEIPSLGEMEPLTLDISTLESGSYFIQLKSADHYSICRKVMVCR